MVINIGTMDLYLLKRFYGNEIPQTSYMKLIQQEFFIHLNKSIHLISNNYIHNFSSIVLQRNTNLYNVFIKYLYKFFLKNLIYHL